MNPAVCTPAVFPLLTAPPSCALFKTPCCPFGQFLLDTHLCACSQERCRQEHGREGAGKWRKAEGRLQAARDGQGSEYGRVEGLFWQGHTAVAGHGEVLAVRGSLHRHALALAHRVPPHSSPSAAGPRGCCDTETGGKKWRLARCLPFGSPGSKRFPE